VATILVIFVIINLLNLTNIAPIIQRIPSALVQKMSTAANWGGHNTLQSRGNVPLSTHRYTHVATHWFASMVPSQLVRMLSVSVCVCLDVNQKWHKL